MAGIQQTPALLPSLLRPTITYLEQRQFDRIKQQHMRKASRASSRDSHRPEQPIYPDREGMETEAGRAVDVRKTARMGVLSDYV